MISVAILKTFVNTHVHPSISKVAFERYNLNIPLVELSEIYRFDFVFYECIYDYTVPFDEYLVTLVLPAEIEDRLKKSTAGILINLANEGYISILSDIYQFADIRGVVRKNVFYVTGALGIPAINDAMFVGNKINIVRLQNCECYHATILPEITCFHIAKKFLCLNRVDKPHRLVMATYLQKHNIIDDSFLSYIGAHSSERVLLEAKQYSAGWIDDQDFSDFRTTAPIFLDYTETELGTKNDTNPIVGSSIEPYFSKSVFSIVNETFQSDLDSRYKDLPVVFPTDKSYKTFFFGHIPIINGGHHLVKYFRDSGFDMFDDIVDHSYDNIVIGADRLHAVCLEVSRLNKRYSLSEVKELKERLKERLVANQARLANRQGNFFKVFLSDFQTALSSVNKY